MARYDLSDKELALLQRCLPPDRLGRAVKPQRSHRAVLNGIFWILHSGAPWRDLPERYGPWTTVYDRFRPWRNGGLFQSMLNGREAQGRRAERIDFEFSAVDGSTIRAYKGAAGARKKRGSLPEQRREKQGLGTSRGGLSTKIPVLCEGRGLPITVAITPGQQHEVTMLEPLLDRVAIAIKPGRPRQRFATVAGDKGYDSDAARQAITERGSPPLISHRKKKNATYPE